MLTILNPSSDNVISLNTFLAALNANALGGHMNKITWLHISDLHMRPSQAYDSDIVLRKMLKDIEACIQNGSLQPDFIIVSGDIAFSSKPEEYKLAKDFLDKLLEITHLSKNKPKDRLFIIPGNHDVDRNNIDPAALTIANGIKSRESVNSVLANDTIRSFILRRFKNYKNFIEDYMGDSVLLFNDDNYYYVKNTVFEELNISILGLNSTWLAGSDNDQGKLVIGDMQVQNAIAKVGNADICLALMHHPFNWLQKFDEDDVEPILSKGCQFILHGHLHEQSISQVSGPGRFSTIIGAGACFEKRTSYNSYNFVQLDLDSGKGKIHLRMYSDRDGGFWTKDTITYSDAPNGIYEFSLPAHICKPSIDESVVDPHGVVDKNNAQVIGLTGIPFKPQPYFAHFFHLQANFTGRADERKMLTNWVNDDRNSVLVLAAIGGMGKSSLAWYWLNNDINHSSLEGIFWWSFYEGEASFTRFLDDAIIYVSSKEINPLNITSTYEKSRILLQHLQKYKFLLILDGFERLLGTYNPLETNHNEDIDDEVPDIRACVDPHLGRFLCDLAASKPKTKVLITSRMKIYDLQDVTRSPIVGCQEEELKSFNLDDAFSFMISQGITKGSKKEILNECAVYGYHPLSLRLLSGFIARNPLKPGDISVAPRYDVSSKLKARRHHILKVAFDTLPKNSKKLLSIAAAFRSTIKYDILYIFNDLSDELEFEDTLKELIDWGLLLFNNENNYFDLHPIVRRYAYDQLVDKIKIHSKLADYYSSRHPSVKKIQNLDEIAHIIEFYYHTAKAGNYDKAKEIYNDKLSDLLFYQFGAYQTITELLHILTPDRRDEVNRLIKEKDKGDVLQDLANAYLALGQTSLAVSNYSQALVIFNKHGNKLDRLVSRVNIAISRMKMGDLKQSDINLQLTKRNFSESYQAILMLEQGRLLAYEGQFAKSEILMNSGMRIFQKLELFQWIMVTHAFKSILYLLMKKSINAYNSAMQALTFLEKLIRKTGPQEKDHIRIEWLIGLSLINRSIEEIDIKEKLLFDAESHLKDAIIRCHNINLVDFEPSILLSWGKWHYLMKDFESAKEFAEKALFIANRCDYRLDQAEIHNFLATLYLDQDDHVKAIQHAEIAYECSWCDGPPHCYKPALDDAKELLGKLGSTERENNYKA